MTLEFLQAINDWQNQGVGINKQEIALRIIDTSKNLPLKFKQLTSNCYRRVDLIGKHILEIGLNMTLSETFSSWTFQKSVAQNFMGGVPPKDYQGVIFEITPKDLDFEVIINIDSLYKDTDFINACKLYKNDIKDFNSGIGLYENCESEVVLNISNLNLNQLWAYGGFSSSKEDLAELFFGYKPSSSELSNFDSLINMSNISIGGNWVTGKGKDRLVNNHINGANKLTGRS